MKKCLLFLFLLVNAWAQSQTLQEYYFNNSLAGTGGGGNLTELVSCTAAPGAFGTDSIITNSGLCSVSTAFCFNAGGGFSYPNTSITGSYSINLFFQFNAALTGYSRIIDFSNGASDGGFYLLGNCLNFYPNGNEGTCPYFQPNIYYLFTFVRDGNTNIISVYVNGTLFSTYNDVTNIYRPATITIPINFFLDDNVVTCEVKPGCIKYASVSSQQLTAAEVDSIWQNICSISLPPCMAAINYTGNPYSTSLTSPQSVTMTGTSGGIYHSTAGLSIDSVTGAINPSASTPGSYIVTYTVTDSGVCSGVSATANVTIMNPSPTCSPNGNVLIFSNYDGGVLNINVDVNIPILKIGVVTYEPVTINLTGAYAANVARVLRAGYPNTNNNNCSLNVFTTSINGPTPANYSIVDIPPTGVSNPNGYATGIICAYSCDINTYQGGCNTIDQVLDYFNTQLGGSVYSLNVQYCCWQPTAVYSVSALSNACCNTAAPSAGISYSGTPFCQSLSTQQVTLTGSTGGSYSASPAGLSIDAATGAINPSASSPGNYTITYTIGGCPVYTTTTTVSILSSPTAAISYSSSTYCTGAPVQQVTISGATGGVFHSGAGLSIDSVTGAVDPSASSFGSYTVTYSLPASGGCSAFSTFADVDILQTISTPISHTICPGQTFNFGGQTLSMSGTYSDTTQTSAGCDSIITLTLAVNNAPNATITSNANIFCPGDSLPVCAPSGLASYLWNTGATGECVSVHNAGNYYVTVTDANNCTAESNHVSLSTYPVPPVSISVSGDTLSAYNANSYQWFLNGNPVTGANANSSSYIATVSGSYQVQVTDRNGCRATSNAIQVTVTGIVEAVVEDVLVFPNPNASDIWTFMGSDEMVGKAVEIYDAAGRLVHKTVITRNKQIVFNAGKGVYYLTIRSSRNTIIHKLIKY